MKSRAQRAREARREAREERKRARQTLRMLTTAGAFPFYVGLRDTSGGEVYYPGYQRVGMHVERRQGGGMQNAHDLVFPCIDLVFPRIPVPSIDGFIVFDSRVELFRGPTLALVAVVPDAHLVFRHGALVFEGADAAFDEAMARFANRGY